MSSFYILCLVMNYNSIDRRNILNWLAETDIPLSVISKKSKVSRATLYNWKTKATKIGRIGAEKIYNVYKQEIKITSFSVNTNVDINVESGRSLGTAGERDTKMNAEYIIDLQKDKIENLEAKIFHIQQKLESKNPVPDLPDWKAIEFDVRTYQEYDLRSNYKYFKTYEMKYYEDFYGKLGYTKSEAETEWKKHQYVMTQGSEEFDYESNLLCDKESSSGFMWNNERTSNFFVNNSKSSMINALQCYQIGYKHKNGSVVHANIYVMYDFVNMSSKSKIKFTPNID